MGVGMLNDIDLMATEPKPFGAAACRLSRTDGTSSDMRVESEYRFASSMTMRVMAIPLEGPR
jgi:hypothetical protein